ncbi:MAG: UDP-N-acetylmuramate--L-alanine ligase [Chloroflexi bacterium]|nr:UDP-N-acetylmuramate--L-alanine ligase [Chloroflexota bacterium]
MTTHYHLIGIGGTGISAIARVLLESGGYVSGSDRVLSPLAKSLEKAGATIYVGHRAENIRGADLVIRSSAIADDNVEVLAAQEAGIPVLKRHDFLGRLLDDRFGIAVAGTHGKTTTTAMLTWILVFASRDPSYIIGGVSQNLQTNAHAGQGEVFMLEADEYDRMFLGLKPKMIVVTNVEHDHPDCFPSYEDYLGAFQEFVSRLQKGGTLISCIEDAGASALLQAAHKDGRQGYSYAITCAADYQARGLNRNERGGFTFEVYHRSPDGKMTSLVKITLQVPGEHNVLNALAAFAAADQVGIPTAQAAAALNTFRGTGRRFEVVGEAQDITIIDDYAHHPTEIRATLAAARSRYPGRRLWAVWQPHTYSRTLALFDGFASSFTSAARVIVTDVYAAREPFQNFSVSSLVQAMGHPDARYIPTLPEVASYLEEQLLPGDVLVVLSAGDADQVSAQVLASLKERKAAHG